MFYWSPQVLCKLPTYLRVIWSCFKKLLWGNAHNKRRRSQFGLQLCATALAADRETDVTGNFLFTSRQTKWRTAIAGFLFAIKNKWIIGHLLEKWLIALQTHNPRYDTYYVMPHVTKNYPIQIDFFCEMTPLWTGRHVTMFRKTLLPASSGSSKETSKLYLFSIYTIARQIV